MLKPIISNFIVFNEPILFHLTIKDATDQTCTNDIKITFSDFAYTLGYGIETINQGDSVKLGGSGVIGGILPLSYHVIPEYNVTDPRDPFIYVSPDSSTTYAIYVIDSAGCISNHNTVLSVIVIPSSTDYIEGISLNYTLFPNPIKDELHLSIETEYFQKGISLTIYNTNGRRILSQSIHHKKTIVHSDDWIPGMYYYELNLDKKVFASGKILK